MMSSPSNHSVFYCTILIGQFLLLLRFSNAYVPLPAPFTEKCRVGEHPSLYPPPESTKSPTYQISLNDAPRQRWVHIASRYKAEINELLDVIKSLVPKFVIDLVDQQMGKLDDLIPQPYQDEIRGIADATGVNLGEIVLYNIFYEVDTVCTSIVAHDSAGKMYHARNLDFGLFLGWNYTTHEWQLTDKLRKTIFNVEWIKDNKTVYKSINFAGYIGIYNAVKQNHFTLTMNQRFDLKEGGYIGVIRWLEDPQLHVQERFLTWAIREVMENASSYVEAKSFLQNVPLKSPGYLILGGSKPGEACVIVRSLNSTLGTNEIGTDFYILQTNYDFWAEPLFIDDRRTPGNKCMRTLGIDGVGYAGLFTVLSSPSNLNMLTVYTTLMQVDDGHVETWIQKCRQPCWFA